MAHGVQSVLKQRTTSQPSTHNNKSTGDNNNNKANNGKTGIGSRRIFPPHFKLQVLDSYRNDSDCKGNQRATARKYGIHRRQIQKWLQAEANLRNSVNNNNGSGAVGKGGILDNTSTAINGAINGGGGGCDLSLSVANGCCRLRDDSAPDAYYRSDQAPRVPCIGGQPEAYEPCCGSPQTTNAAMDYSSSSSDSSLCDMPLSTPPSTFLLSPSLSPSQYHHNSPSPILEHPYINPYHSGSQSIVHEPIDLSLKHYRAAVSPYVDVIASVPPVAPLYSARMQEEMETYGSSMPEVWDLSVRKRTYKQGAMEPPAKRPVKLFKPYLDDNQDNDAKPDLSLLTPSSISNGNYSPPLTHSVITDYPSCCPIPLASATTSYYHPPHYLYDGYTCLSYLPSSPITVPLKQRQSYSVDFKLRAIESYYYGDECCRGNQRAVANKYNVHRRQVQKWLRQEDELRTRHVNVVDMGKMTGIDLAFVR